MLATLMVQGGVILGGIAAEAEAQAPRALPRSVLEAAPVEQTTTAQSHLKWRPSSKVSAPAKRPASKVQPASHVQLTAADGHSVVQNVSTLPPADPFNDPFGDQIPHYTAQQVQPPSRFSAPPSRPAEEPMPEPMPEPMTESPMLEEPSTPTPMQPTPMQPAPTQPMPMEEAPMEKPMPEVTPMQPMTPPRSRNDLPPPLFRTQPEIANNADADCEQVYLDRNCCEESDSCREIRTELGRFDIRNISLDISSPFAPDEDDPAVAESMQAQAMQGAPSREWRNIQGEVIADGRMLDIRDRRVLIDDGNEIKRIRIQDLGSDEKCFLTAHWNLPYECGWTDQPFMGRHWAPLEVNWTASALCHKPLYFEDRALERYGHMTGPISQVALSGAHFFGSAVLLPYQMGMYPPTECRYALGYYRPGNCAPHLIPPVPLSARGAAFQAAAVVGAVYWIP
ncbi:hypothetical protein [Bremerella sp. P1]|uniref:hypothetical protein n=1 Tax=Bremerella sp. P1 TaxID=3026424 RepID=UPI002368B29D|nr:hypothetical protein [Bremerella sp. P1]WDI42573.1 hypothetical protein PSR63_01265 [Bremerella sp. P1]